MTRTRLLSAALAVIGLAMLFVVFLAWRQGGMTLLQLDFGLC